MYKFDLKIVFTDSGQFLAKVLIFAKLLRKERICEFSFHLLFKVDKNWTHFLLFDPNAEFFPDPDLDPKKNFIFQDE